MKWVKASYDKLPTKTRIRIRSILPKELLRWYSHKNTDVYLVSYPKCGRTWLRLMIGRAVCRHYGLPDDEDVLLLRWNARIPPEFPKIMVVHEDRPMLKTPDELQRSKDKYRHKKIIFLVRDPRDVIVSSYFEMKNRGYLFGENPYETKMPVFKGSLSEFIDNRVGGFDTLLAYYNIWANNRTTPQAFLLVRYEDMKENPKGELRRVINFLGLEAVSEDTIDEAVEYASFDNMQKMESQGKFEDSILLPADKSNKDSFKTRRGKVKGFVDYLNETEILKLNRKMEQDLSDYFGYYPYANAGKNLE